MGGAIIHVIFEILERIGKLNQCFSPDEIVDRYKELRKEGSLKKLIKAFRKYGKGIRLKTLEDEKFLKTWLCKHTNVKPIFWFQKCSRKNLFKLKKSLIKRLKREREKKTEEMKRKFGRVWSLTP